VESTRQWISKPLRDLDAIGRRSDAIQEIIKDPSQFYSHLRFCLKGLMDLERGLTTIYYKKCSILDFINVMSSFAKLQTGLQQGKKVFIDVRSALIRESFLAVETNTQARWAETWKKWENTWIVIFKASLSLCV
jgi:DNA mismatch repair ATPase MutS